MGARSQNSDKGRSPGGVLSADSGMDMCNTSHPHNDNNDRDDKDSHV